uniref:Zinc finger protein CONSTANS-LIKE 16-like isoform X1 n=1 Tax=Rhizophora mucronata TaxID=61149 RepID=A0A2P2MMB9_RHIMU
MGYSSFLIKSPKKEEQEVPETVDHQFSNGAREANDARKEMDIIDELESILGIDSNKGEENLSKYSMSGQHGWDFMDWEENHPNGGCEELGDCCQFDEYRSKNFFAGEEEEREYNIKVITTESVGVWDVNEKNNNVSLNLNLNYQDVLDAWSDRGPLWVDNCTLSMATNGCFMGEVPVMEEEKARREASVLRYKEKRRTRLISKKIRYQVRKLNADKRPRLKGRFVKRVS